MFGFLSFIVSLHYILQLGCNIPFVMGIQVVYSHLLLEKLQITSLYMLL